MALAEKQQENVQVCEKQLENMNRGSEGSGQEKNGRTKSVDWSQGQL